MRRLIVVLLVCFGALALWAPCVSAVAPGISALYVSARSGRQVTFAIEGSIVSSRAWSAGWPDSVGYWRAEIQDIAVCNTRAYVAAGLTGLRIYYAGDPAHLAQAGVYQAGDGNSLVSGVAAQDYYAYVVHGSIVDVVDVADPAAPKQVSQMWIEGNSPGVDDVQVVGSYAYVAGYVSAAEYPFQHMYSLHVFDISDPTSPRPLGSCRLEDSSRPVRLTIRGTTAYVGGSHLSVVDIADPAAPRQVAWAWAGPSQASSICAGPAVDGTYAFVASDDMLAVFNIAAANRVPRYVGSLPPMWPSSTGVGVTLTDPGARKRYALVAYNKAGDLNGFVQMADASHPLRLDHDHGDLADGGSGDIDCVTVAGDWAYVGRASESRDNLIVVHLGPAGYSWTFDRRAGTVPDKRADGFQSGLRATATVKARGKGIWYFHVRARDKSGHWGPTATLRVRVS